MSYMLYHLNEFKNAMLIPAHTWSKNTGIFFKSIPPNINPYSPILAASAEMIERSTRIFPKPSFGISSVEREGIELTIKERVLMQKPFCSLRYFERYKDSELFENSDPRVLIAAPLTGHFATLLRDTVRSMLPFHNVYITDWEDSRQISMRNGTFNFDTYIDYLLDFFRFLGEENHVIAVCQPSTAVLSAVSLLSEYNEPCQPRSMTLIGGPIDTRLNQGVVNKFATEHSMKWFEKNMIVTVPTYYKGGGRRVCPGFIMLTGFISMNIERHQEASWNLFNHLIVGDQESAENHRKFYDEYRAVMDLPADYFLDSVRISFKEHLLARKKLTWRGYKIHPHKIKKTALLTVEGELDDISCPGQTLAAHNLCSGIPQHMKSHHFQEKVGHYGVFNGKRWRTIIQPKIQEFIKEHSKRH